MTLEYFRQDPIGILLFASGDRNEPVTNANSIHANYPDYSMKAFYLTLQDIQELENSTGNIVPGGRNVIVASTFWFLALESYINTLLKLTCLHLHQTFETHKNKTLADRLSGLLRLLKIDTLPIKKTGLYGRINEFSMFRNEIFHDRNAGQPVQFVKTLFSPVPIQCNLVDVLQGLLIFLETSHLLRYAVSGLDSMPDIPIHVPDKVFHKKLDILYAEVIRPAMEQILQKHQLHTNLNLAMKFPAPASSSVFSGIDAAVYRISDSPDVFIFQMNSIPTKICYSLFSTIVEKEECAPHHLRMGHYTLNT